MTVEQMERQLQALAVDVEWPESRDLAPQVRERVAQVPQRRVTTQWLPRLRPALAVAGLLLAVFAAVLVVSPGTRSAVASWLGLGGVAVERTTDEPSPQTSDLNLGEPVTAAQATAAVDYPVRGVTLEDPQVYLDQTIPDGMVSLVYPPQPGAPATGTPGVGAILTQFQGQDSPTFTKELVGGNDAEFLEFGNGIAMWVTGSSHMLIRNSDGEPLRHTARLASNALVWVGEGGVTYRLESALTLDEARELAETLD